MKTVKLIDVAREAGVGLSTASMILGGRSKRFSQRTIRRVMDADRRLGYSASRRRVYDANDERTDVVYCLRHAQIRGPLPPFYSELAFALERELSKIGKHLTIKTAWDLDELRSLVTRRGSGLWGVVAHGDFSGVDFSFIPQNTPYVFMLPHFQPERALSVELDNLKGTYTLVRHLHTLGHRRLAFLGFKRGSRHFMDRLHGFLVAVRELEMIEEPPYETLGEPQDEDAFRQLAKTFIANLGDPDCDPSAVVCSCSNYASILIQEARQAGVAVPGDLSVAGFNDLPSATPSPMPLLSVKVPLEKIAAVTAQILASTHWTKHPENYRAVINCDTICPGESARKVKGGN